MQNSNDGLFNSFLNSEETIWVCREEQVIFQSQKKGIAPLIEYIHQHGSSADEVTVFDRVVGNAAALLLKTACCKMIYSAVGSEIALKTLEKLSIPCFFIKVVPYIINRKGDGMCPFEKASIGKSPDEFFEYLKESHRFD